MTLANRKPAASTLCTLPPECLLAIISHLPPASYGALVQTSHHLLAFFSVHAATICNTYILSHYSLSSSYLYSTYTNGWLVPSHPAIAAQEKHLLSPPALHIYSEQLRGRLLLSTPGPQYLQFLTRYDFEIRTRREMADGELAGLDDTSVHAESDEKIMTDAAENDGDQGGEVCEHGAEREEVEERFAYMVGTYAIKPFLRKLDDVAEALEERRGEEGRRRFDGALDRMGSGRTERAKKKFGTRFRGWKEGLGIKLRHVAKRLSREKRELCFGEIESDEEVEKGARSNLGRDGVVDGLLWFYGVAGVAVFGKREEMRGAMREIKNEGVMRKIDGLTKKGLTKGKRVERVKLRVRKALGQVVNATACFGTKRHFESLE